MAINYPASFVGTIFTGAASVLTILLHFGLWLPYAIYVPILFALGFTVYAFAFGIRNPITLVIILTVLVVLLDGFLIIGWYGFNLVPHSH